MLWIKMFRDLKQNIVQFLTIFIMAFICLFVVAGLSVTEYGPIDRYLTDTNFRDLEVQGDRFSADEINALKLLEEVRLLDASYNTTGKLHLDQDVKMLVSYLSGNDVSRMYLVEGVPYTPGMNGIWLDDSMCRAQNIHCGDILSMTVDGKRVTEEVMGTVYSPTYIYYAVDASYAEPVYGEYGFAYLDELEYPGTELFYNQLLADIEGVEHQLDLTSEEVQRVERAKDRIAKSLDHEILAFLSKEQDFSLKTYKEALEVNFALLYVFPVLFGLIALLGIMTTMTRMVARQRVTIGALKALGFTSGIITLHYISYSVVIVLLGCVLGAVSGYFILGEIMNEEILHYYLNPYNRMAVSWLIYFVTAVLLAASILVGYLSNQKILRLSASQILQPEAPKQTKKSWYESFSVWKKLKFTVQWNIRDISRNSFRTLMSIFGVVLCSALIFSGVGFLESLMHQPDWQYGELIKAKNKISFTEGTPYQAVYEYAKEYEGQMLQRNSILVPGHETEVVMLTVVDPGSNFYIQDPDGSYMDVPEQGVGISYKFANDSGFRIGDPISWRIQGKKEVYSAYVSDIYREPMMQGILISRQQFEAMHGVFEPGEVYTNHSVSKALEDRDEIDSVNTIANLKLGMVNMSESNYFIIEIMIVVAIILGVSILYNLGSMSYSEKIKDLATLKVLGFRSRELKAILMQQNLMITGIGSVLGIPLGFQIIELLGTVMGETVDCMVKIDLFPYIIDIGVTFGLSVLINLLIVSKLEEINMVEALKGV